jgi:hypothetical protein
MGSILRGRFDLLAPPTARACQMIFGVSILGAANCKAQQRWRVGGVVLGSHLVPQCVYKSQDLLDDQSAFLTV